MRKLVPEVGFSGGASGAEGLLADQLIPVTIDTTSADGMTVMTRAE
jgi:hypothetical protein